MHGTFIFISVLLLSFNLVPLRGTKAEEIERHPNDGWFNNLLHPDWGVVDSVMLRNSPASYQDGVYEPSGQTRPNPLDISRLAFHGKDDGLGSYRRRSALLVFFGQQLVEEIVDAQRPGCPMEYFNIKVPKDHKTYNPDGKDDLEMPFLRARYDQGTGHSPNNPRQQLNEITPFLDGNLVYGAGKAWEDALRSFKDGLLLTADNNQDVKTSFPPYNDIRLPFANPPSPRDHVLRPVTRFRLFGNPRAHENPFLVALATVWFRYHNYLAKEIKNRHSNWTDDQIFNGARKRLIAQYQKITMYDWLPLWLHIGSNGETMNVSAISDYKGYDPNVHPGISMEFQAAAMRYGHTLVPSVVRTIEIKNNACTRTKRSVLSQFTNKNNTNSTSTAEQVEGIRLCNSFWVPRETVDKKPGVEGLLVGMMYTKAGREDNVIVSDLSENTFGPLEWSRRDLGALNIQRGRDLGLPGYNDVREAYGLGRKTSWMSIANDSSKPFGFDRNQWKALDKLKALYNRSSPDNLDLFTGGLLETTPNGPGELFQKIIIDQFRRIRDGDRFWYENYKQNKLFTRKEIKEIKETTFFDVLQSVLDTDIGEKRDVFVCKKSKTLALCDCFDPVIATGPVQETCVPLQRYDYFTGSEYSFIAVIVVLSLFVPATFAVMCCMAIKKKRQTLLDAANYRPTIFKPPTENTFYATEWIGRSTYGHRDVKITMDKLRKKILVSDMKGLVVRMLDLRQRANWKEDRSTVSMVKSSDKHYRLFKLSLPGEIDLVLHFPTQHERDAAHTILFYFFPSINWVFNENHSKGEAEIWHEASTLEQRKETLATFFREILNELSKDKKKDVNASHDTSIDEDVLATKLTRSEFADALGLQPHSLFVRNMFLLVDTDGGGLISFDEFKKYFGILCEGSAEQKAEMFFKMFNSGRNNTLSRQNFKQMVLSMFQLNENKITRVETIDSTVDSVFKKVGREKEGYLTLEDFKKVMSSDENNGWDTLVRNLEFNGQQLPQKQKSINKRTSKIVKNYRRRTFSPTRNMSVASEITLKSKMDEPIKGKFQIFLHQCKRKVSNHWRQIFWVSLYTLITLGIFAERFYTFAYEREHAGLRRITGYGVSVTRGAASAMMFTFSSILVTMNRNMLTALRETFLHRFIPFDNAHDMHIYIAFLATFFSIIHVVGHLVNLYHICTQPSIDLNCYFREYFRSSDTLASFHYWAFQTVTGLTGVFLTLILAVIVVFALPYSRRNVFKAFRATHKLYILLYILITLHGSQRMVQEPYWGYFFVGPLFLFIIDKFVSSTRKKVLIPVHQATLLPSGVINLVFKKPLNFNYQSGQWVQIACPDLANDEYHPFTLTSAPHEDTLSLHIRAVGPWTNNLRRLFHPDNYDRSLCCKLFIDGPFGEGHQDWYKYPVSVLIGGGIGITPFASILKDIAHRSKEMTSGRFPCQKVYFLWVTRTQQSFEWMTDIIRKVESVETSDCVNIQICITQLKDKFDLRTAMLYMCERHFQKIAGMSMFTGLRAKTHFGRPRFIDFFDTLKNEHPSADQIGVFSCGPPVMTSTVQNACSEVNRIDGPSMIHYYENF